MVLFKLLKSTIENKTSEANVRPIKILVIWDLTVLSNESKCEILISQQTRTSQNIIFF